MDLLDLLTTYTPHPNVGGSESKAKLEEEKSGEKKEEESELKKEEEPIFVYNQGIGRRGLYHKYQGSDMWFLLLFFDICFLYF